ncbi:MAG: hybrid sensor histidine kinase/response regulator [Bacilli bacterium]|nr:hybrid sensor histidine kinase/response regulator [Bacilli bacterium]
MYILMVTLNDKTSEEKMKQTMKNSILLLLLIIAIDIFFLPINVNKVNGMLLPTGPAVNLIYACVVICVIVMFTIFFKNIKNMRNKKFIPLYLLIAVFGIIVLVQKLFPNLLIINPAFVFITFVMYFTIENPDVKIIDELSKNRTLVNKTMEDKSNFLFLAASQLKRPIEEITRLADASIELKKVAQLQENFKEISNMSHDLSILVNNVMDISNLSYSNIKMIPEKYNLKKLLTKIKLLEEKKINENIEFRFIVDENIPEYLNGDSKLLEQTLISILENSIKYTKSGFIELSLNTIVKYDMVRLIFTIEDSGLGMTIDKVNELLLVDNDLTKEELKRLETNNVNMNTIKKLVAKLGGYFTIKSEVNKGTEVKVVVDQMIVSDDKINLSDNIVKNKVLVASRDKNVIHELSNLLNEYEYNVETSIYSNDIIDRIRLGEEFVYIFIDDNMDKRAIEVLNELKEKNKSKIKLVVLLDSDMNIIKEQFIRDGFSDYIMKDNLKDDLKRVLE